MSITDIYKFIQEIGKQKDTAGSVIELSIFSHAWKKGPVLVNSDEHGAHIFGDKIDERDPTDKDGRDKKDFEPKNMPHTQLKQFRNAFHLNAFVWLWGCQFGKGYGRVMQQILKDRIFSAKVPSWSPTVAPSKFADLDIKFNFDRETSKETNEVFFPPPWDWKNPPKLNFTTKGKDIIDFFKRAHEDTYCNYIAKSLRIKCYGAFIGTYSEDENKMKKKPSHPVMRIPRGEFPGGYSKLVPDPVNFTRYINFFTKILHYKEAPEGRGYGTYEPPSPLLLHPVKNW